MTKTVRIENADTSDYRVKITVQDKGINGDWQDIQVVNLDYPTAQSNGLYLTSTRRFIVEENGVGDSCFVDKKYIKMLEEKARNAS